LRGVLNGMRRTDVCATRAR